MEVVNTFNKELKSIMEAKLPVSRHKMSLITKSAMKALKFYKHVVQSVEKFIAKCSCDYKVPGLYVIDAIVRQSKHQYCDKDVFVPRFMRNIVTTFIYLSQCDPKDIPCIERVLRLWQQNGVFPTDLVEALLDIIYNSSEPDKIIKASTIVTKLVNEWNLQKGKPEEKMETFMPSQELFNNSVTIEETSTDKMEGGLIDSITKLLKKFHAETGQDVSSEINQVQSLHEKIVEQSALLAQGQMIDADTLSQLHQSMEELTKKAAKAAAVQQSKLAMLDDKDNNHENITDMEFVEQLQQMVDTLGQTRALQLELRQAIESRKSSSAMECGGGESDKDLRVKVEENRGTGDVDLRIEAVHSHNNNHMDEDGSENESGENEVGDEEDGASVASSKHNKSMTGTQKRKKSQSPDRIKKKIKTEARRKYQPSLRPEHIGIISHTIFIGHLNKHLSETKLRSLCEEYGEISEFNMIPPRGCAFVTFKKRKSSYKAVSRLHEQKFEGRELKVAWAPNKGVKDDGDLKGYWVENEGCTYVPVSSFPINRAEEIVDGGAELDASSVPEELQTAIEQFTKKKTDSSEELEPPQSENVVDTASAQFFANYPPPPPPGLLPPPGMIPTMGHFPARPPAFLAPPPHGMHMLPPMHMHTHHTVCSVTPNTTTQSSPTSSSNNTTPTSVNTAITTATTSDSSSPLSSNSKIEDTTVSLSSPTTPVMSPHHRTAHLLPRHVFPPPPHLGLPPPTAFIRPPWHHRPPHHFHMARPMPFMHARPPPPTQPPPAAAVAVAAQSHNTPPTSDTVSPP